MADRVFLTIGTKKSVFVADAAKPRRSFAPDPYPEFGQCVLFVKAPGDACGA